MSEYEGKYDRRLLARCRELEASLAETREVLDTLCAVVGLTPIAGNKDALQEAMDNAFVALAGGSE